MISTLLALVLAADPTAQVTLRTPERGRTYEVFTAGLSGPCRVTDRAPCEAEVKPGLIRLQVNGGQEEVQVGGTGRYDLVLTQTDRTLAWVGLGFLVASPVLWFAGWGAAAGGDSGLGGVLAAAPLVTLPVGIVLGVWGLVAPGVDVKAERRYDVPAVSLVLSGDRWSVAASGRF